MKSEAIKATLKAHNPFAISSMGDPWNNLLPDVTTIYHSEFEQICDLIRQKQANPEENFACLVTGEAGSGKTHLIGRILAYCKHDQNCSFAYVQPLENYHTPYHYLLKEIVTNLCRNTFLNGKYNQLDRLIGILFAKLLPRLAKDQIKITELVGTLDKDPLQVFDSDIYNYMSKEPTQRTGIKILEELDNQFDDDFLNILFSYRIKEKKRSAIKWLKQDYLDIEDQKILKIMNMENLSDEELEEKSRLILRSLGILFSYTNHSMVLCFDRLENLDLIEQTKALGKGLEYFVDVTHSFLPLVFYRGETWERQVKDAFNQQIVTRLETNRIDLQGCNVTQSMEIIRSRLKYIFDDSSIDEFGPFDEKELRKRFVNRITLPREVINEANTFLKKIIYGTVPMDVKAPIEVLAEKYKQELSKICDNLEERIPDGSKLFRALKLYLQHFPPNGDISFEILEFSKENLGSPSKSKRPNIELLGSVNLKNGESFKVLFIADDAESPLSIQAYIKRCISLLTDTPEGKAFYIRDERSTFQELPKWKETHIKIEMFSNLGGCFFRLNLQEASGWYALTELDYQLGNRDLTYLTEDGSSKEFDRTTFSEFIKKHLHSEEFPWFYQLDESLMKSRKELATPPKKSSEKAFPIKHGVPVSEKNKSGNKNDQIPKKPNVSGVSINSSDDSLSNRLVSALTTQDLVVEIIGIIDGFRFTRFKVKPVLKKGTTVKKIKNQAENLQVELSIDAPPFIQAQAGYVSIDIPKLESKQLYLMDIIKTREIIDNDPSLTFPLGMSIDNQPFWADFSDPNMSSMLVGGCSGSGKSIFLKSIAIGLATRYPPSALKIVLIDPKRVSFSDMATMPHLSSPVVMDNKEALKTLTQLVDMMEKRYQEFEAAGVVDIVEYNKKLHKLPRYVILIDEYADLMMEKKSKEDLVQAIQRIGQKGRAAGIHLVLSTQRPDAKVITPLIKANLQLKVALKVTSVANSMIILDQAGAECLLGKGDMLVGGSLNVQRLQGPMVKKVRFVNLLKKK